MGKALGEEDKRKRDEEREKNLLTADLSTSDDGGKDTALFFFKHGTETKLCSWEWESGEKRGAERQEEQEVDGKVIAVSTWSIAWAVCLEGRQSKGKKWAAACDPTLYSGLGKFGSHTKYS